MTNVELNTLIDAKLSARAFPGLKVVPSADDAEAWDVVHTLDHRFDRRSIPVRHLGQEVSNVMLELEAVYGATGEKLFDLPLHLELVEANQR